MKKISIILVVCLLFFSVLHTIFKDAHTLAFLLYFAAFNLINFIRSVVLPEVRSAMERANDNTGQ